MSEAQRVEVALGARSYPIFVGENLIAQAGGIIAPLLKAPQLIVVSDSTVARYYLHAFSNAMAAHGVTCTPIILPPGEGTKSFGTFETLLEKILELKPDRRTVLVALGGGVIGDITGFAASILLRGLDFVQVPTTLLAQVDSSVGGKTAINSRFGKNLIGSFHQPKLVLADTGALATLPPRELKAGYAEALKYGLINDPEFFAWMEANGAALLAGDAGVRIHAVTQSCRAKAAIVAEDEKEAGARALLNFGHTFAHALEAETGYGEALLHGEAVAIGMMMALRFSQSLGLCDGADVARVAAHYEAAGLPASLLDVRPEWNIGALMEHFTHDKKAKGGALTFVLSRGIGRAFVAEEVEAGKVQAFLQRELESENTRIREYENTRKES